MRSYMDVDKSVEKVGNLPHKKFRQNFQFVKVGKKECGKKYKTIKFGILLKNIKLMRF